MIAALVDSDNLEWRIAIVHVWRRDGCQTGKGVIVLIGGRWVKTTALAIDPRTHDLAPQIAWQGSEMGVLRILKARKLSSERQQHIARRTLTMLGNNNLRHTTKITPVVVLIDMIVFGTMHEEHHIRILLNGS